MTALSVCSQCGHSNVAESNFCNRCGARLSRTSTSSDFSKFSHSDSAERKLVSILFADIVGSTTIVGGLDPEDALAELAPAIELMKAAVKRFGGTVAREQGDGILAFFGAPRADDYHSLNACLAGLEIVRAVGHLAHRKMQARVGIHSDEVLIRIVDGELGLSYDATGAAVHLASRLESIAQPGSVLVSAATYTLTAPYFDFVSGSPVIPKGFTKPIPVFSISGQRNISRWLARGGSGVSPFVNRTVEIRTLNQLAEAVADGAGKAAVITATAGSGKSRLVHEFLAILAKRGWSMIEAEAQPTGQATPYSALKRILLSWLGCSELDNPSTLADLLQQQLTHFDSASPHFMSALSSVLDLNIVDTTWREAEPGFRRRHVVDAFRQVISITAEASPLALLIEDLQWVDSESAAVINSLGSILSKTFLMIVGTARSDIAIPVNFGPEQIFIGLPALDDAASRILLDQLLGFQESVSKLKTRLLERTGGIPLFIEEVVRRLIDTGAIVESSGSFTVSLSPEDDGIPRTVQASISARVDALPARIKRVLQSASVLAQPITVRLLQEMSEEPSPELRDIVRGLEVGGFLVSVRTIPEIEFTFVHELVREVVYSALIRDQRRSLHGKALQACMEVLSDRVDEFAGRLAHHAYESQNWPLLLRFARLSAARAIERSAFREAALQFQRAIEAASKLSSNPTLEDIRGGIDVRLQSRLAFSATAQLAVWIEFAEQAEEMAAGIGDERRELAAIINRAQAMNFANPPQHSIDLAEPALKRASQAGFHDLELLAWYIIGQAHYAAGNYRQTIDLLTQQLEQLRGDSVLSRFGTAGTTSVLFLILISMASASIGDFGRARQVLDEATETSGRTKRPYDAVACSYCRGFLFFASGHASEATSEFRNALDLCREFSINLFIPLVIGQLGAALTVAGLHGQAVGMLERVVRESENLGHNIGTAFAKYALATAYRAAGRLDASRKSALSSLESTQRSGFRGVELRVLHLLGLLDLELAEPDLAAAEASLVRSADLARALDALPSFIQAQLTLADLWARTGKPQQSAEALDAAERISHRIGYHGLFDDIARRRSQLAELGISAQPTRL
jgi:class 3 adenylate cyclase/predicted ATPase